MGEGVCRKSKLWNAKGRKEIESLALDQRAGRRRDELLRMLDNLDQSIEQLVGRPSDTYSISGASL